MGAELAGRVAPRKFHALNLVAYRDGSLGPRAGLFNLAPTGTANGLVWGLGWRGTAGGDLFYVQGTAFKLLDAGAAGNAVQSVANALGGTPTRPVAWFEGPSPYTYVFSYGDGGGRLNHSTDTWSAFSSEPAAGVVCVYGERVLAGGISATPGRVFYSAALDATTWTADQFFDVGDGRGEVRGLFPQRGFLAILLSNGEWWVLTGVPGVNDVLRRVSGGGVHPWHQAEPSMALLGDDQIAYVPSSSGWPAMWDGARIKDLRHLDFLGNNEVTPDSPFFVRTVKGFKPEEYAMFGGKDTGFDYRGKALLYRHGIHTFHNFDIDTDALAASDGQGKIFLTDRGAAGTPPKFYVWQINLDRPAFTSDAFAEPGDDSTSSAFDCYLEMPEVEAPPGMEIVARAVTVEATSWQHGGSFTNNITIGVDGLDRYEGTGVVSATAQSFNEAQASSSTSGTKRRITKSFAMDPFAAVQVKLSAIRGCSIRRVVFDYETVPWRGRP